MGGCDKGLQELGGRPLVAWVVDRLRPQVDELLINANRNGERYAAFGDRVIADRVADFRGPLAGLQAALIAAAQPLVATVPCDCPFFPLDLVSRLLQALTEAGADLAVARTQGQPQPVFSLCRREILPQLGAFLDSGGRRVDGWYGRLSVVEVAFDGEAAAFENINTPEQLGCIARASPRRV
jgi:molybdopterin-guanine dinucleotide biosynthesis protein A